MKKKRRKKYTWKKHTDYDWICDKIGENGGVFCYSKPDGRATISSIFGKNKIQIFWYNIILFIKYFKRKIKRHFA